MNYRQCTLVKETEKGTIELVSYIPSKFAKLHSKVRLKDEDGNWSDGWTVTQAGQEVDEKLLPDWRKEIRGHRKNTGDNLPKNTIFEQGKIPPK